MFYRKRKHELTLNLTPLIDVVFLLLIFFMVSTSFTRETQIALSLPTADGHSPEKSTDLLEINIDINGNYFVNGQGLVNNEKSTLIKALKRLTVVDRNKPVIISSDAKTAYQNVITAMDAAGQAGYSNLSLATRKGDD